jgi:hypothetical protein
MFVGHYDGTGGAYSLLEVIYKAQTHCLVVTL